MFGQPYIHVHTDTHTRNNYCNPLCACYGTNITDTILDDVAECPLSLRSVKKILQEKDRDLIWRQVSNHESLTVLTRDISWLRLWDDARDYGIQGTRALESALRTITIPYIEEFSSSCHICGHNYHKDRPPAEHIMVSHLQCDLEHLVELLQNPCEETFTVATSLKTVLSQNQIPT